MFVTCESPECAAMDDDALDIAILRWWCGDWDERKAAVARMYVGGRAVCDARALMDLSDATFDLPPTQRTLPCVIENIGTMICVCHWSDRPPPWNLRSNGVLLLVRDFDELLMIRADKLEEWLDRWTPLWKLSRRSAVDAADAAPTDDGV